MKNPDIKDIKIIPNGRYGNIFVKKSQYVVRIYVIKGNYKKHYDANHKLNNEKSVQVYDLFECSKSVVDKWLHHGKWIDDVQKIIDAIKDRDIKNDIKNHEILKDYK